MRRVNVRDINISILLKILLIVNDKKPITLANGRKGMMIEIC